MDLKLSSERPLMATDFTGLSAEHLTEIWQVYVWVAMKNGCYEKRQEQYCSLKLIIERLNELTNGILGEVFLYLMYFKTQTIKDRMCEQERLTNTIIMKITSHEYAGTEARYRSIHLILACIWGQKDIINSLLKDKDLMWHQFTVIDMIYVGEPKPDLVDLQDHPRIFQYTPAFYSVSCDSHVGLQVLLQRGLLEKISLRDLMVSCVSLRARECLKLLFHQFVISASLIKEGLRFSCVKRNEFIPFFREAGGEFNEDFLAVFPSLLHDVFQLQVFKPAKCFHVFSTILSSIPPESHTTFINYHALKSLVYRMSYVPGGKVDDEASDLFIRDIELSFEAMMHANPSLLEEGKYDLIRYCLRIYHGLSKHIWLDKRVPFLQMLIQQGFEPACNYPSTGDCALSFLGDMFAHEQGIVDRRPCENHDIETYKTLHHILTVCLRQGCNPNFMSIEDLLVRRYFYYRPLGVLSSAQILTDVAIRLDFQITCFSLLWRAGAKFPTEKHMRKNTMYQYLLHQYDNGFGTQEKLQAFLHLCSFVTIHTDFAVESRDQEFFKQIKNIFSSCIRSFGQMTYHRQHGMAAYLLFFISFLDRNQRVIMANELRINDVLESNKVPSNTDSDTYAYVREAHTLLTSRLTLRDTCILLTRKLIFNNHQIATESLDYHGSDIDSYWISEGQGHTFTDIETIPTIMKYVSSQCPLLDLIESNLPLPKSLCREVARVNNLNHIISEIWSDTQ